MAGGCRHRRRAEPGDLVVVYRGGAVHRQVGDHTPLHELDKERRQTGFDDVSAEHHDYRALLTVRRRYRFDDAAEVARHEHIGKRGEEIRESAFAGRAGRGSEFLSGDLVRPPLDWNGAYSGQVCFRGCGSRPRGFFL